MEENTKSDTLLKSVNNYLCDIKCVDFTDNELILEELDDFYSFEYIVFNSENDNPCFDIHIYNKDSILFSIYSDLIKQKYVKKTNDKYVIKLPIDELIDSNEIYSKIFEGYCKILIETHNPLENIKLVYNVKTINMNDRHLLEKYTYNLQIKQIKKYSYNEINNILFNGNIYGIYLTCITSINHVKIETSKITHNLDKEIIDLYCKKINKNTIYVPLNMISTYKDNDIKYTLKLENENIKLEVDTKDKDTIIVYVVLHKNIKI